MSCDEVCPVLARMSLLTSQLANAAATAIEHQDPCLPAGWLTDDELDTLLG